MFEVPKNGFKKYTALVPIGGKVKRVHFGDRRYQHFKDSVPMDLGGGKWSRLDNGDLKRRKNYRNRHGGMLCSDGTLCISRKYSPSWFSYNFLW